MVGSESASQRALIKTLTSDGVLEDDTRLLFHSFKAEPFSRIIINSLAKLQTEIKKSKELKE